MVEKSIRDKYFELLDAYVTESDEQLLLAAGELGRKLVTVDTPPEEIGEIHEEALKRLARRHPDAAVFETIRRSLAPLMEMLMAYGMAFRYRLEERKALEEQLREAARMESVGRLAGGVAHDFNNILTGIIGYTQILLDRAKQDAEMCRVLSQIRDLAQRAAGLTRQLLAFGRRLPLEAVVLDVNGLIEDDMRMLRRVAGEDVEVEFVPAPDLGKVRADPHQVEEVLMNLVINARDAMPKGGKLTIETANLVLDQQCADGDGALTPGRYVMIMLTDTGCGMDEETQKHVFEPFFSTKKVVNGTGLSLATTYGIVKQHHGHIEVQSAPGKGTSFEIYLPCVDEAEALSSEATEGGVPARSKVILIADDEEAVRTVAERGLRQEGYTVLLASCAEEAEELFARHGSEVDLLLTNVVMPGCGGQELYERLKARRAGLNVLYMSGHPDGLIVRQGRPAPDAPFIRKPFTPGDLATKVREVLER